MANKPKLTVLEGGNQPTGPSRAESDAIAREVISQLTDGNGRANCPSLRQADELLRRLGFRLLEKSNHERLFLLPGGWQFIYQRDRILTRIKTKGTQRRPRPHMTVSLTLCGTGWDQEQAKYNSSARPTPAMLSKQPIAKMPALARLNEDLTPSMQDDWANNSHFDFSDGFDDSAADTIQPD